MTTAPTTENLPSRRFGISSKTWRLAAGCVILAVILGYVDIGRFFETLASLNPSLLVLLLAAALLGRVVRAWKWNSLLHVRGIHISNWQAIRLSLIAHFAGAWTPGQLGADAYRMLALRTFGKSGVVFSTVLIERYAGLCAVCFYSIISLPVTLPYLYRRSPWLLAVMLGLITFVVIVVPCLLSSRVTRGLGRWFPGPRTSVLGERLRGFFTTLLEYRQFPGTLLVFGLATLLEVLSYFFINYLAARALGLQVSLIFFLFAMPLVHLLLRIPISIQGIGVQEGCLGYALVQHGFTVTEGLAMSVVQRALEWVVAIVPGGLLLWLTPGPCREPVPRGLVNPRSTRP